jgi:N-acetylglucosaminyldiphosphoundecaprenol N-acetyl-beta-D-mannosaminyltransferase
VANRIFEDEEIVAAINRSQAVMPGVGAAFDFLAGTKSQAPRWMMRTGLEWLYRLATEPRRLWKRYLKHNPRFVVLFTMQLMGWMQIGLDGHHQTGQPK